MDLDITQLPCKDPSTDKEFTIDLTSDVMAGKAWTMALPVGTEGHELVACTEIHRGGISSKNKEINSEVTSITLFIPTPGRCETADGNIKTTWEFHSQHLDFMIAYFDALDKGLIDNSDYKSATKFIYKHSENALELTIPLKQNLLHKLAIFYLR